MLTTLDSTGQQVLLRERHPVLHQGYCLPAGCCCAGGETTTGTFKDPLADEAACKRDVPIMAAAGTNAIRTYAIDPTADHSACMKLLDEAGIYVISDLSEPSTSINRDITSSEVDGGRIGGEYDVELKRKLNVKVAIPNTKKPKSNQKNKAPSRL